MIFQYTWEKVLAGQKTQTRRIVKPEHWEFCDGPELAIDTVFYGTRIKWQVGRTYAVQPGRGKPAVGRIKITAIRKERVQDITEADAVAEGFAGLCGYGVYMEPRDHFFEAWNEINNRPGCRVEDKPAVWVLELEQVPEPEPA